MQFVFKPEIIVPPVTVQLYVAQTAVVQREVVSPGQAVV
jgi:hypothetical protein